MNEDIAGAGARDPFLHSSIRAANPERLAAAIVHLKSPIITGLAVNAYIRVMRILGHEVSLAFCNCNYRR